MMEPDLRLLLVRHGHATANHPWTFLGHTDVPLSQEGQAQGEKLAGGLEDETIDAAYVSPLLRAQQTARLLMTTRSLPFITDKRLIEQNFGAWEGMTLEEAGNKYPGDVSAWQADEEGAGPTNGETLVAVAERARHFMAMLREEHHRETILVVGHGAILNALICILMRTPLSWLWAYRLEVGTITEVLVYGAKATLVRLNDH